MSELLFLLFISIIAISIIIFLVKRKLEQPTISELKAVEFITGEACKYIENIESELFLLESKFNKLLHVYLHSLDSVVVEKRREISTRIDQKVDKHFVQSALKSYVPKKKWKAEFDSKVQNISKEVMCPNEIFSELNEKSQMLTDQINAEVKNFQHHFNSYKLTKMPTDEVTIGLARMLSDKARSKRFLQGDKRLEALAVNIFMQTKRPSISRIEIIKKYGFNFREMLASFQSIDDLYMKAQSFTKDAKSIQLSKMDIILDASLIAMFTHLLYHLSKDGFEGVASVILHGMLGHFTVIIELMWDEIKQALIEEFGEQAVQEILMLFGELATGIIVLTIFWRAYRYYKIYGKAKEIWNGDSILPKLKRTMKESFTNHLETIIERYKETTDSQIKIVFKEITNKTTEFKEKVDQCSLWAFLELKQKNTLSSY